MKELPLEWWPDVGQTPSATAAGDKGACKMITGGDGTQVELWSSQLILQIVLTFWLCTILQLVGFQVSPGFDTEIDQWVFVGQLSRAINLSPIGDYDFDGIDSREYQVLSSQKLCIS